MKKAAEITRELLTTVRKWGRLEDQTIKSAEALMARSKNPLVKATMEMIKHDSEKHKVALQLISDSVTKQAPALSPDELAALVGLLNKHMEIEARSIQIATEAYKNSHLVVTSFLISALLEDESKHHRMIAQLSDELKRAAISSSTGARRAKGD